MFDLPEAQTELNLTIDRTNALVRGSIIDANGQLLAAASSNGTSLINGFLPLQNLTVRLPKGRYYLVLSEAGGTAIGTPYSVKLLGVPM